MTPEPGAVGLPISFGKFASTHGGGGGGGGGGGKGGVGGGGVYCFVKLISIMTVQIRIDNLKYPEDCMTVLFTTYYLRGNPPC